jgi:hypothetical protein
MKVTKTNETVQVAVQRIATPVAPVKAEKPVKVKPEAKKPEVKTEVKTAKGLAAKKIRILRCIDDAMVGEETKRADRLAALFTSETVGEAAEKLGKGYGNLAKITGFARREGYIELCD